MRKWGQSAFASVVVIGGNSGAEALLPPQDMRSPPLKQRRQECRRPVERKWGQSGFASDAVLLQHGRLTLTADMTINDIDLREAVGNTTEGNNVQLYLNVHTLTIRSSEHKKGRGWYAGAMDCVLV